jgi:hypothetical protein
MEEACPAPDREENSLMKVASLFTKEGWRCEGGTIPDRETGELSKVNWRSTVNNISTSDPLQTIQCSAGKHGGLNERRDFLEGRFVTSRTQLLYSRQRWSRSTPCPSRWKGSAKSPMLPYRSGQNSHEPRPSVRSVRLPGAKTATGMPQCALRQTSARPSNRN